MSKKISVSTASMHLMEAKDPIVGAVVSAILNNGSIPDKIMQALFAGLGIKMRRFYDYAVSDYYLKLPYGETAENGSISNLDLAPYIATDIGFDGPNQGVLVEANTYTTLNPGMLAYDYLVQSRGYDLATNIVNNPPAGIVYDPVCIEKVRDGSCITWADGNTTPYQRRTMVKSVYVSPDGTQLDITYSLWYYAAFYIEGVSDESTNLPSYTEQGWYENSAVFEESIPMPAGDYVLDEPCIFAIYQKLKKNGLPAAKRYSWYYTLSNGTYPLEPGKVQRPDRYLPVVPVRYYNVDYTDPDRTAYLKPGETIGSETQQWITSRILLRKLGMDFEYFGSLVNQNPSVGDIDHAYVMFGVDVNTEVNGSIQYLYDFFEQLETQQNTGKLDYIDRLGTPTPLTGSSSNSLRTTTGEALAFNEMGLDLNLRYDYIEATTRVGKLGNGSIGTCERKIETYYVYAQQDEYGFYGHSIVNYALVLEKQVSKRIINKISVMGLRSENNVYGGVLVTTDMDDVVYTDDHNLIIPIQYKMAQAMNLRRRNELYADGSLMILNSYVKTSTKWYESSFFKFILVIVAVVIAVYTGQAWLAELAAAASAGAMALIETLLISFAVGYAASTAALWLVDSLGVKWILVVAMVLAIASAVYTGGGSFQLLGKTMTTSQMLLQGSTSLISGANEFLIEEAQEIQEDYEDFTEVLTEKYEELEEAQALLKRQSDIDPLMWTRPQFKIVPNESPDQFYQRCLGLPSNSLYTVHDEIPNFIGSKLTLPKPDTMNLYS